MKKILLVVLMISLIISACSKKNDEKGPVLIRLDNQTGFQIEQVLVNTDGYPHTFDTIKKGDKSEYKEFLSAYRYGYIRLKINEVEYIQQPIDYVGETKLEPGKHTYKLELLDLNGQLSLRSTYQKD